MDFPIERHIRLVLKKYFLSSLACATLLASSAIYADEFHQLPMVGGYTFSVTVPNAVVAVAKESKCIIKNLTAIPGADPRLPLRLSNDGEYVILSEHDYIAKSELVACAKQVKVTSIKSFLFDVNKSKGLVLSADVFSVSPDGYLAELYDTKTKKSIIRAKGFFDRKIPVKKQLLNVFSLTGYGVISRDGQYVSVNGEPDCTGDSYPGVYDLKTGKLVNGSALDGLDGGALDVACKKLFE